MHFILKLQKSLYPAFNGVICVILGLAIFVELRLVTDRWTDRRTHDDNIYRASIALRGKNVNKFVRQE